MSKFIQTLKHMEKQVLTEMAYGFSTIAKPITQAEMVDLIRQDTTPDSSIKFTSVTDATYLEPGKTNRKGVTNNIGTVYKVSQCAGLLNTDYAARKQEKLDVTAPGTQYVPGKSYGVHQSGSVVEQNGKFYIQVLPQEPFESPRFVVKNNIGQFKPEDKSAVEFVMKPATQFKSDSVGIRRYGAASIVAIEIGSQSYVISDVDADRKAVLDIVNNLKPL